MRKWATTVFMRGALNVWTAYGVNLQVTDEVKHLDAKLNLQFPPKISHKQSHMTVLGITSAVKPVIIYATMVCWHKIKTRVC